MAKNEVYKSNVSLKDVANKAKCGATSVSRYLNGEKVSDKLKISIESAINELNYHINPNALALRKKDNVIFIVSPSIIKPRTQQIIQNLNKHFFGELFIYSIEGGYNANQFKNTLQNVFLRNPKEIIIFLPYEDKNIIDYINSIDNFKFIVITPLSNIDSNHTTILIDDYSAFKEMILKYIKNIKPNNLAFIGRTPLEHNLHMDIYNKRIKAFFDVVKNFKDIQCEISFCEHNTIEDAITNIKRLYDKGYKNFICGTHTIFRACISDPIISKECLFTDYGGNSLSDYPMRYIYKIFIDYEEIANKIINIIQENEQTNKIVINPKILEKNS